MGEGAHNFLGASSGSLSCFLAGPASSLPVAETRGAVGHVDRHEAASVAASIAADVGHVTGMVDGGRCCRTGRESHAEKAENEKGKESLHV
jgi:hypothetical protein